MNVSHDEVLDLLRERVAGVGSMRAYARQIGVSAGYLHDVIHGNRLPGPAILTPLGFERLPIKASASPPPEYRRTDGKP